jgi:phage gp36-like protein
MALYAVPADVRLVLSKGPIVRQPDLVQGNASTLADETLIEAIEQASSEIDGKLGSRYTIPFDPIPPLVKALCVNIAAYLGDLTFREVKDHETELSPVYLRYQRAQALLEQLQIGSMVIPPVGEVPDPEDPPGAGGRAVYASRTAPLFGPCDFDISVCGPPAADYWTPEGWAIH